MMLFRRLALTLFCGALPLVAQDKPFSITVGTRLIVQTVSVTAKSGKVIEGLTKDDFILTEDNVPQIISVFEFERLDDTAPPRPSPVSSTVATARGPAPSQTRINPVAPGDSRYQDRRLLALYFDLPSLENDSDRIRAFEGALTFLDKQMSNADLVAIMTYGGEDVRVLQDFTDDRVQLQAMLTALLNGAGLSDYSFTFGQESGEFALFNTDRQLAALQTAVKMLGVLNEKKSLIDFTTSIDVGGIDNQSQFRATLNAARRANVSIFPVDSRGLIASAPMGNADTRSPGGLAMYNGASAMAMMRGISRSQDALYTLAADTGGKPLVDYNDLSMGIVNAQRANSSYYILGYYTTNTNKDGKLRRVKITLKNPELKDAKLAYREAYYGDKEFTKFSGTDKERQLEEALALGDPITELPITLELNYFQINKAEYFLPIVVRIPGNELVLAQKAGAKHTVIDFIGEIRNEYGTIIANLRDKVEIKTEGETATVLASSPIFYDAGYTVIPGEYIIKVLARNAETGRIGTFQTNFVVPNLNKEVKHLPISSVVLSSQRVAMTDAVFNAGKTKEAKAQIANPLIEDGVKLVPNITRVFSKSRELFVYLQAYEREAEATQPLVVYATFFRGAERAFDTTPIKVTEGMDPTSKAVPVKLTIPLDSLANGEYLCQITVLDSTDQKAAFWQAPVKIVP